MSENKTVNIVLAEERDERGNIQLKGYDYYLDYAKQICETYKAETITDQIGYIKTLTQKEELEKVAKAIAQRRLKAVHTEMKLFEEQSKEIEKVFKDKAKEFQTTIDEWFKPQEPDTVQFTIDLPIGEKADQLKAELDRSQIAYVETKYKKEK